MKMNGDCDTLSYNDFHCHYLQPHTVFFWFVPEFVAIMVHLQLQTYIHHCVFNSMHLLNDIKIVSTQGVTPKSAGDVIYSPTLWLNLTSSSFFCLSSVIVLWILLCRRGGQQWTSTSFTRQSTWPPLRPAPSANRSSECT